MNAATRDEFEAIAPAPVGAVEIGDAANGTAASIVVRPLKIGQLPAFARAARPLADKISAALAIGITAADVLALLADHTDAAVDALAAATGASREALADSTLEQLGDLLAAVISANKDFLRGRLIAALRTAAAGTSGAGPTPSSPLPQPPAGSATPSTS